MNIGDHSFASGVTIDFTEQETAQSDASAHDCFALKRPKFNTACPPPPSKFTRRQAGTPCDSSSLPLATRSDISYIKAMRRHICEQIYDSELCPVIGKPEQEGLWASLDTLMQ